MVDLAASTEGAVRFRFEELRRRKDGVTLPDGSRMMCERCRAVGGAKKDKGVAQGRRVRVRAQVATWEGYRVERDGRRMWVAYCDQHFRWWNEIRLGRDEEE